MKKKFQLSKYILKPIYLNDYAELDNTILYTVFSHDQVYSCKASLTLHDFELVTPCDMMAPTMPAS